MNTRAKLCQARRAGSAFLLFAAALCFGPVHAQAGSGAPAVPDTLKQRIASCTGCHGEHGEGTPESGFFPRLAGKPAGYLARQLKDFQDGLRKYGPMEYTVRYLTPEYMQEIAAYFAAQDVPYARSPLPRLSDETLRRGEELATKGDPARDVPPCAACHGTQFTGVQPDVPGLVGLPYDYLSSQLGSWRTRTRATVAPDCMAEIANRLSAEDISAVSVWLASRELPPDMHAQAPGSITPPLHCGVLSGSTGS